MNTINERLYFTNDDVDKIEKEISRQNHIKRYLYIRHLCKGEVVDFGCGCGYGSYIISQNPDVNFVNGIDINLSAIEWAKTHFKKNNISFELYNSTFNKKIDVLIAIEVIEHILDMNTIPNFADQVCAKEIIISFPSIKTIHFNKYHHYDFQCDEIVNLFKNYNLYKQYDINQHVNLLHFVRK